MYSQIYLDYNATTYCDPAVLESMLPFFADNFGNASSDHHPYGWMAKNALDEATQNISKLLGIRKDEIVYTSGSTEGINMILKGIVESKNSAKAHIITAKTEHKAVLDVCKHLQNNGHLITWLDVDKNGIIDTVQLENAITTQTDLVAIMYANNETGVIQPLDEIAAICQSKNVPLFSDATQALGKLSLNDFFQKVDFACFSGHKIYGPKGIGFNYIKKEQATALPPFIHGGGQQRGLRGGTYNLPAIVGLSKAISLALQQLDQENTRLKNLKDQLEKELQTIPEIQINGMDIARLANTTNVSFPFVDGKNLLRSLSRKIAVSNGSACNSAAEFPSHVLIAMGLEEPLAFASLRISLGRKTTGEDLQKAIKYIKEAVNKQRENNILWEQHQSL
ncbi:MAG: cysteine desulfurase [Bacteroidetes bacterium]|nr:cysteine desulfurase [Bacteroidota bacterium]